MNKEQHIKQIVKRSLLVSGAVLAIGAAGAGTLGVASAATDTKASGESSLIDKLVSKFNLNKDDVQKLFDEDRATHEAEREQRTKEKLDALVKEGKITQEQEDKLIAKAKELKEQRDANRESMQSKTDEERRAAMDAERDSLKQWLSDNGIAEEYGRFAMGGGRGHGGPGGPGGPPPAASTNTTN